MRKIVVFLLLAGILLGMISVIEEVSEERFMSTEHPSYEITENAYDDPVPCDGREGSGGGGVPG